MTREYNVKYYLYIMYRELLSSIYTILIQCVSKMECITYTVYAKHEVEPVAILNSRELRVGYCCT